MRPVLIAIDAGGTSTRCAVVTMDARCVGFAQSGPANPLSAGSATAVASLASAATDAVVSARIPPEDVRAVTVAMAGISSDGSLGKQVQAELRRSGMNAAIEFESDAAAGFCSGTAAGDGSVLIAGTGAAAVRMHDGRAVATADGLGWLLGDVGSGFWIGHRVVRAAVAHLDGRGPSTALTALVLAELGPATQDDGRGDDGRPSSVIRILTAVYAGLPVALARFAPLAFAAESRGDAVAEAIIDDAAAGLHASLRAVMGPSTDPIVASGGLLSKQPALRRRIEILLRGHGVDTELIPVEDGLTGAATLALRSAGTAVDETTRRGLQASIDALRPAAA